MLDSRIFNPLRWKKSFLMGILAVFLLLWIGFIDNYSIWARYQISREKATLEKKIDELKEETRILEEKIEALKTDPNYLEKIAREEYGMRKPGETIYQVREK